MKYWYCLFIFILLFRGSTQVIGTESYLDINPFEWKTADPEKYGLAADRVTNQIEENPFLRSVLIVRYGKLIYESYFNDGAINSAFHIHSASKSFISALFGIAADQGLITDLDQKMMDFFPEYATEDLDPKKFDITLKHLLTMTAGLDFDESANDWGKYTFSPDRVKYAIELPLIHYPGEDWNYGTVQTHILSAIITKVTGMSTKEFAQMYLFEPLGITIDYWARDPKGIYTGGHEMYLSPRDMLRFGYLFLRNGTLNNQDIVSKNWVELSTSDQTDSTKTTNEDYGYLWWIQNFPGYYLNKPVHTYSARGLGGQNIYIVPELDTVIVTTASGNIFGTYPNQYEIIDSILQSIFRNINPDVVSIADSDDSPLNINTVSLAFLMLLVINKRKL
ncbi:MAG: serine hydrolase [Candidatus Heimdallarchaeota archaeon]|nr:serine hydrolase [Candidatus Heimdallarchaeota archaeon]